jgi:protein ImuB
VAVAGGRPVRVTTDRRGFTGGAVTHCAGPWRTSGHWWAGGAGGEYSARPVPPIPPVLPWDRDEWDVSLSDGGVYRVYRDRDADRWFIDAIAD